MTSKSRVTTTNVEAEAAAGAREPLPVPPGGWPPDEFTGQSGRFVRDPFTGVRSPAPPDEDEPTPAVA